MRLFLEALIQDGYRLVRPRAGTPQGGVVSPLLANIYLARLDRVLDAGGVSFVRYAGDVRLSSRTPSGARQPLMRTAEVLQELGLRLSERKTKLVTAYEAVDFLGYRLVVRKGHLNVDISPKALERFRAEVRRLTRRTAGRSFRVVVSRLDRYVRGWENTSSGPRCRGSLTGTIAGSRGGCAPTWRSGGATGFGDGTPTSGSGFTSGSPDCITCVGTSSVNSRPGVVPAPVL